MIPILITVKLEKLILVYLKNCIGGNNESKFGRVTCLPRTKKKSLLENVRVIFPVLIERIMQFRSKESNLERVVTN